MQRFGAPGAHPRRGEGQARLPDDMKHRVLRVLPAAVLLVLLLCACALAATEPVDMTMTVAPTSFSAPGDAKVSIRVSRVGDGLVDGVTLYDDGGKVVPAFGDGGTVLLDSSLFYTWEGDIKVTQAMLDAGQLTYTIKYNMLADDGSVIEVTKPEVAKLTFTGEKVSLKVTRTITPEVARSGQTVTVLYELLNDGNVGLTNISIRENSSVSSKAQSVAKLAAGASAKLEFTVKSTGKTITSEGTVSYKAEGGKDTKRATAPKVEIPAAKPNLTVGLTADKTSVDIGDTVTLTLTMTNKGNVSYSGIKVTDAKMGEVFTNLALPAGETLTQSKQFTMLEPVDFKFTCAMSDNTGTTRSIATEAVRVSAYDPDKVLRLTLTLTSDKENVPYTPAQVRFNVVVTNSSNVEAKEITIRHGTVDIYTIASLKPSQSMTVTRDYTISQSGAFRFTAACKDTLNNDVTFESNEINLPIVRVTATPTLIPKVTLAPLVTLEPPTEADIDQFAVKGRDTLGIIAISLAAVFALVFVLFAVSSVIRIKKKAQSNAAYDHLELASRRVYTEESQDQPGQEDTAAQDDAPVYRMDDEELPSEKYIRAGKADEAAAQDAAKPEDAVSKADSAKDSAAVERPGADAQMPVSDGTGGYRLSRADAATDDDAPAAPAESQPRRRRAAKPADTNQDLEG